MRLYNIYDKQTLRKKLEEEKQSRVILSFYRYVSIQFPSEFRDELYTKLTEVETLGRIYIAHEGVNAQLSVPDNQFDALREIIDSFETLKNVYFNRSVAGKPDSFLKLKIKCRKKIVNDGLDSFTWSFAEQKNYVTPKELNRMLTNQDITVIDLRNNYESKIGYFKEAIRLPVETYREAIRNLPSILKGKQKKNILLYCTGGIRCEKASVYLKDQGFQNIFQLKGGIINYFREVVENKLTSLFIGKNFVFDQRLGEKISEETIANCTTCGAPSDDYTNCENEECHELMIQCIKCSQKYKGCCSEECREIFELPIAIQRILRRKK